MEEKLEHGLNRQIFLLKKLLKKQDLLRGEPCPINMY